VVLIQGSSSHDFWWGSQPGGAGREVVGGVEQYIR